MPVLAFCCLLLLSFSASASDQSVLKNGTFSSGGQRPEDWQTRSVATTGDAGTVGEVTLDAETYHTESPSAKLENKSSTEYTFVSQIINVEPHTPYLLKGWVKEKVEELGGEGRGVRMAVANAADGNIFAVSKSGSGSGDWEHVEVPFNSGDNDSVRIFLYLHQATGTAWFDDIEVVAE